jgi:hypothetical protein
MGYVQSFQKIENASGSRLVQIAGGFIAQKQPRIAHQSPCQRYPLLLSTGELSRPVFAAVPQVDLPKPIGCSFQGLTTAHSTSQQRHRHVFSR